MRTEISTTGFLQLVSSLSLVLNMQHAWQSGHSFFPIRGCLIFDDGMFSLLLACGD